MVVQEDVGFNLALPLLPHSGHQMQEVIAVVAVAEDRVLVDASVHEMDGVAGGPGVGGGEHGGPFIIIGETGDAAVDGDRHRNVYRFFRMRGRV